MPNITGQLEDFLGTKLTHGQLLVEFYGTDARPDGDDVRLGAQRYELKDLPNPLTLDAGTYRFHFATPANDASPNGQRPKFTPQSFAFDLQASTTWAAIFEYALPLPPEISDQAAALLAEMQQIRDETESIALGEAEDLINTVAVKKGELVVTPQQFGAVGNGTTNDTAAMQAWLDALIAGPNLNGFIPPGKYRVTQSIKRRDTGVSVTIRGAGSMQSFLYGDFVGAGDAILDLSDANAGTRKGDHRISGIGFLGNGVAGDPIGLLMLNSKDNLVEDINAPQGVAIAGATNRASGNPALHNSLVVVTNDNNSKWINVRSQSGCQPKAFNTGTATASFTSGATTITASSSVFTASMVGQPIYFASGALGGTHEVWRAVIVSQTGTACVIDRNAPSTASGVRFTVGHITGSVTNGSNQLVLDNVVGLTSAYVGMQVHVLGGAVKTDASSTVGLLSTRVTAVSGNTITMESNATASATGAIVVFAGPIFLGSFQSDPSQPQTNHSWWINTHLEGYPGAGLIANRVYYARFTNLKLHGAAYSYAGDWSECYMAALISEVKTLKIEHVQAAYGVIYPSGFYVSGSRGTLMLDDIEVSHLYTDRHPVTVATATDEFRVMLGDVVFANSLSGFPADYPVSSAPKKFHVTATGQVTSREKHNTMSKTPGSVSAGLTSQHGAIVMAKDTVHTYKPPGDQGILVLMCSSSDTSALITYRTSDHTSGGLTGLLATPTGGFVDITASAGPLTGTTGTDGRVRVRVDTSGGIQIENRRSTLLRVSLTHLAYGV